MNGSAQKPAERERYYRSLLHCLHEHIVVLDCDYRIVDLNASALKVAGLADSEVIGRYCYEVFHQLCEPCYQAGAKCGLPLVLPVASRTVATINTWRRMARSSIWTSCSRL